MRVIWKPGTHLTNICEIPILQCKYRVPIRNQDISVKEGEKEIYYVPDSLKDVLQVKDKKKYNLNYDIVSEIRVIGE